MTDPSSSIPGQARMCPHCTATILLSATVCPACQRYVRFDPARAGRSASPLFCPLHVEGTIRHPPSGEPWEYSVVLQVQDNQGEVLSRHVVGVGALEPAEARTFTLRIEVFAAEGPRG